MIYLYNENNEFNGMVENGDYKNSTTQPVKPLFFYDKAKFDNNKWNYTFEKLSKKSNYKNSPYIDALNCFVSIRLLCHNSGGEYKKQKDDKITVLIPCYKKAAFVKETVLSALKQTMKPYNIIVLLMDEKSIALKEELENLSENVTCVISEQKNACAARTYLVELCKTEYFIFLDADDKLMPNYIEEVYKDESSIVFAPMETLRENCKNTTKVAANILANILSQNLTSLLCKEAFYEIGLDEQLCKGGEDSDFLLQLFFNKKWKISFNLNTFFCYRAKAANTNSLTSSNDFYHSHFLNLKNIEKNFLKML